MSTNRRFSWTENLRRFRFRRRRSVHLGSGVSMVEQREPWQCVEHSVCQGLREVVHLAPRERGPGGSSLPTVTTSLLFLGTRSEEVFLSRSALRGSFWT
mmetsp:Transcript_12383/g.34093  ORF Transcript_12383/g.34093 Transcript_12383/m.34093 type:complete len:99 (+) Transcript_12383:1032-1328(+)